MRVRGNERRIKKGRKKKSSQFSTLDESVFEFFIHYKYSSCHYHINACACDCEVACKSIVKPILMLDNFANRQIMHKCILNVRIQGKGKKMYMMNNFQCYLLS